MQQFRDGPGLPLKVFDGKAAVSANGSKHKMKKKWSLAWAEPDSEPIVEKFDRSKKDSLHKWQGERVAALEAAERRSRAPQPQPLMRKGRGAVTSSPMEFDRFPAKPPKM